MDPTRLMRLTGTLVTPTGSTSKDAYNDDVPATASTTVKCWVEQTTATEDTVDTTQASEDRRLYLPVGCGATAQSTLAVGSDTYQVTGPPWTATNPRTGLPSHVEAKGRQVR